MSKMFFLLSLLIFLLSLVIKIEDFPIYFLYDEAIQAIKAQSFINNGMRDQFGNFLPLIIRRSIYWDLGLTVYLNLPGLLLFGKQIWVIRCTTILFSLMGNVYTALILKNIFKVKNYWAAVLFVVSIPIYFLNSRTGFEIAIATAFYSGFLYYYFLYRTSKPTYIFPALLFAAFSFYSVNALWVIILVSLGAFALFDLPYHLKQGKKAFFALIFATILFFPFAQWLYGNFSKIQKLLTIYEANPVTKDLSVIDKISLAVSNYLLTISPNYLFNPDYYHHPRYTVYGYGYFNWWSVPLILLGLFYLLTNLKKIPERILLIALLISPLSGALVGPETTRILPMAITFTCLFGLGIKMMEKFIDRFKNKINIHPYFSTLLFITLTSAIILMVYHSLRTGHIWFTDYGLYGMQYGAKELYRKHIPQFLENNPGTLMVSPTWANEAPIFAEFFLPEHKRDRIIHDSIYSFIQNFKPIPDDLTFLMTPEDLQLANDSQKFKSIHILNTVPYPNGSPGFYFAKLEYVDNIEDVFQMEIEERKRPISEEVMINGEPAEVTYTSFNDGGIANVFDNDSLSFVRGWETGSLSLEIKYDAIKPLKGLVINTGVIENFDINLTVYPDQNSDTQFYTKNIRSNFSKTQHLFDFADKNITFVKIKIEVVDLQEYPSQIHIFDIKIR